MEEKKGKRRTDLRKIGINPATERLHKSRQYPAMLGFSPAISPALSSIRVTIIIHLHHTKT
jgi:hypothetical protein